MAIIMITGLPGTGKTTLAAALAEVMQARHLNTDIVREELGMLGKYDPATKTAVYEELLRRAEALVREGKDVVIDGTFYRIRFRESFAQLAARCGRDIRWIELRAAEEVIRQRVSAQRPHSEADFDVYQKIKAAYEPLEHTHLILRSDQLTLAEMVARAQDFLTLPA